MCWGILVLIPKADSKYRGIGLLDTVWKVCSSIINARINDKIEYHKSLHGFRQSRGTGTAKCEAKLLIRKAEHDNKTIFQAFIDLSKAYYSISRKKIMEILKGYGVGPRCLKLIECFGKTKE